jgi:hypothetical protein
MRHIPVHTGFTPTKRRLDCACLIPRLTFIIFSALRVAMIPISSTFFPPAWNLRAYPSLINQHTPESGMVQPSIAWRGVA